jgi:hypothetical protein
MDFLMLAIILVFFISAWLLLRLCDALMGGEK